MARPRYLTAVLVLVITAVAAAVGSVLLASAIAISASKFGSSAAWAKYCCLMLMGSTPVSPTDRLTKAAMFSGVAGTAAIASRGAATAAAATAAPVSMLRRDRSVMTRS